MNLPSGLEIAIASLHLDAFDSRRRLTQAHEIVSAFTLYGTIPGKVLTVSDDAVPLDKEKGGLVYASRVSMDRATMQVEGKRIHLSPGMAVTVEVKTGQRQVIDYPAESLIEVYAGEYEGALGLKHIRWSNSRKK